MRLRWRAAARGRAVWALAAALVRGAGGARSMLADDHPHPPPPPPALQQACTVPVALHLNLASSRLQLPHHASLNLPSSGAAAAAARASAAAPTTQHARHAAPPAPTPLPHWPMPDAQLADT
jgi:hypothetical protein